ncbi:MAG: DMT family transporter [Oscillospiraceae bacterium]|nr:DMT family transporter [Oscillospiraceae bacterium]
MVKNQRYKGILLIICSAFCFAVMNACVKLSGDLPSVQKSFFRNFIALLIAGAICLKDQKNINIPKGSLFWLILRASLGTVGILCNYYALDHLVLSDASMLNKMSPFFTILFSWILLKEKLRPLQGGAVLLAFIGSLFIIKPSLDFSDFGSSLIGLTGGMAAGCAYSIVRILGQKDVPKNFIVLFFSGFSCLITLPYLIFQFHIMTLSQVLILILAGIAAAGGQFSITAAYCYAPAKEISVYDYSQIIFATALGFFLFDEIPDKFSFFGYIIIILSAISMFWYNNYYLPKKEQK